MTVMIDALAERYGLLPSEVIQRADTYDLYVMDAAMSYANYRQRLDNGQVAVDYTKDEMLSMMETARGKNKNKNR